MPRLYDEISRLNGKVSSRKPQAQPLRWSDRRASQFGRQGIIIYLFPTGVVREDRPSARVSLQARIRVPAWPSNMPRHCSAQTGAIHRQLLGGFAWMTCREISRSGSGRAHRAAPEECSAQRNASQACPLAAWRRRSPIHTSARHFKVACKNGQRL